MCHTGRGSGNQRQSHTMWAVIPLKLSARTMMYCHQKTAPDEAGHRDSVNWIRWYFHAASLLHFAITSSLNALMILGRPLNCNSNSDNSGDTIHISQCWKGRANMNGQKDLWEMRTISKSLRGFWPGSRINKSRVERRQIRRNKCDVPRTRTETFENLFKNSQA